MANTERTSLPALFQEICGLHNRLSTTRSRSRRLLYLKHSLLSKQPRELLFLQKSDLPWHLKPTVQKLLRAMAIWGLLDLRGCRGEDLNLLTPLDNTHSYRTRYFQAIIGLQHSKSIIWQRSFGIFLKKFCNRVRDLFLRVLEMPPPHLSQINVFVIIEATANVPVAQFTEPLIQGLSHDR